MVQATDDIDAMEENLPEALKLLAEMNNSAQSVNALVDGMLERVKSGELSTEYGLSFLEVKYHTLLDYLINLTFVVLQKCAGNSIEKDPSIERLLELRTILERIRPIDYKLRYQIDKLVKTATTGYQDLNDPTNYKARPELLVSQLNETADMEDDDDSSEDDDDDEKVVEKQRKQPSSSTEGSKLYRPPKLTSMPYEDDDVMDKRKKQLERARKRALGSSVIQEMKEEFLDAPIEIQDGSRAQQMYSKAQRDRERFEEDNFVRLPITKADKHRQKRLTTLGTLGDEITSFRDISALTGGFKGDSKKGNKRKLIGKKKKGGKKKKFH